MITLKGKVKGGNDHSTHDGRRAVTVGERWEIPFLMPLPLGEERRNVSSLPGHWLHSIRLTPEPSDKVLIEDIRVGNNSVFAGGSGQAKAKLLNQFPLTFKVFEDTPSGYQVRLFLSGSYDGLCEVELISPISDETFRGTPLLRMNSRTQVAGKISELIITQELRTLISENRNGLSLSKGYGEEFAHQIFDEQKPAIVSLTPDGRAMLNPPIHLEIGESLMFGMTFELNTKLVHADAADMMAILEPTTRWET